MKTIRRLKSFLRGRCGVSALEYAILVGVIVIAVAAALNIFGGQVSDAIRAIGSNIGTTTAPMGSP